MKNTLVLFAMTAALVCAADSKTAGPPPGVPKGAVMSAPYTWKFTDSKGKKWVYRQTPFGYSKAEDIPEPAAPVVDATPTKVTDQGETVKFERRTPFGVESWTKKKSELTDEDRALLDKSKQQPQEKQ